MSGIGIESRKIILHDSFAGDISYFMRPYIFLLVTKYNITT